LANNFGLFNNKVFHRGGISSRKRNQGVGHLSGSFPRITVILMNERESFSQHFVTLTTGRAGAVEFEAS